jgi:hypothetical protein
MSFQQPPQAYRPPRDPIFRWTAYGIAAFVLAVVLVFGLAAGCKSFGRYQRRADANNNVKVSNIEIRNQAQRVVVAKQKASIRLQNAIGVREAQDEIAKTLTPLYVQFEMVDALKTIAASGQNNSIVYIPAGANGIPLVSTLPGPVGLPQTKGK